MGNPSMKTPYTLEKDIRHVLTTGEGWTTEIAEWMAEDIKKTVHKQMASLQDPQPRGGFRLSQMGQPCVRKGWYDYHDNSIPEPLPASDKAKFIFGDLTESFMLALCMAAGHSVEGMQSDLEVEGIPGHRDAVIDGMTFDVKSSSSRQFEKFKKDTLRENDPFGYMSQGSSYVAAAQDDPLVTYKNHLGFLAMDKQFGHVSVSIYDVSEELENKTEELRTRKATYSGRHAPPRLKDAEVPFNKSGNMKLNTACSYCHRKHDCFPNLRTFLYSSGPVFMTKVVKEPQGKVLEV